MERRACDSALDEQQRIADEIAVAIGQPARVCVLGSTSLHFVPLFTPAPLAAKVRTCMARDDIVIAAIERAVEAMPATERSCLRVDVVRRSCRLLPGAERPCAGPPDCEGTGGEVRLSRLCHSSGGKRG